MKRLLITGAYGLVGSNICKALERDYPDIEITKAKFDEWTWTIGLKFDYIIHAAGYGQPAMFGKDKLACIHINTRVTEALFHCLKSKDSKFLFISSSEVYSGAPSPHKETDIGTTTPQHPRACYIEGKRCGEAICMAYKEQGYDVKIARLALAYGPGTKKHDTRVLNELIEQGLTKHEIVLKDAGKALRTYIYIDDAVTQMLNILFKGKDVVYNVGGTTTASIHDYAAHLSFYLNCPLKVPREDNTDSAAPLEVRNDMTKTLIEFPMEFTSFKEGFKRTIEYQKELYGIK